jgi:hypothetical protein
MLMHLNQCDPDFRSNSAQRGDALVLLQSLPDCCTPLVFFDPRIEAIAALQKAIEEEPRGFQ